MAEIQQILIKNDIAGFVVLHSQQANQIRVKPNIMNNQQKAEEYAAKILESNHTSCWGLVEWHDALTEAVLHGIKIGQDEVYADPNPKSE